MKPEEGREALGDAVRRERERRRLSLNRAAALAGISHMTWINVEKAAPARGLTYRAIEEVLQWEPGSVDAILDGGDPTPTESQKDQPSGSSLDDLIPPPPTDYPADMTLTDDERQYWRSLPLMTHDDRRDMIYYRRFREEQARKRGA